MSISRSIVALAAFNSAFVSGSSLGGVSIIKEAHAGSFTCVCSHDGCSSPLERVRIVLDRASNLMTVDYGNEVHSGAPARIADKASGDTTYNLATDSKVGFKADGQMAFGWGRLWTCARDQ